MNETQVRSTAGLDVGSLGRRGAAAMLARTIAMRVITAVGTVILARILVPADFGVYAVLVLVQQVLMFFADFGVGPSLVQQQADPTYEELATAWLIQQLMWIVFGVAIWVAAPLIERQFPSLGADFGWQLRVISLSVAFTMLRALPSAMLVRVLRFREVATIEVSGHIAFWATAVSLAVMGAGAWSFVIALTVQSGTSAALANWIWRYWPGLHFDRAIAKRLLGFGVAFQASNVAETLRDGVVPLFGGLAGTVAAIGYLQFSLRVSQLTSSVDEIISRVTFPAFSRIKGEAARTARVLADSVTLVCLLIGAPQAWIIATAPLLIPAVFGDQWRPAAPALQLMCLGVLATVPSDVAGSVVFGQGRPRIGLLVTLISVGLLFVLFPLLLLTLGLAGGGLAYAIASLVGLALQARAVRPVAPFPWPNLIRVYFLSGLAGLASWFVAVHVAGAASLIASAGVFGVSDLALLWIFDRTDLARSWHLVGADRNATVLRLRARFRRRRGLGSGLGSGLDVGADDEPGGR
jgi:O-antigen/teichoic acid export membrane protein